MQSLTPHADLPHLRRVRLADAPPEVELHPTWLQLAADGFRVDNRIHVAIAALRMDVSPDKVRQQLGRAYSVLGNPDRRVAKAFDVACDIVEVQRHTIRIPDKGKRPERFTTEFQNGRRMGLMEPPRPDQYRQMAREKVVDEGDSLRGRIREQEAKEYRKRHGDGHDPNWHLLPKSAMRDVAADRSLAVPMTIRSNDRGELVALQEMPETMARAA